MSTLIVKHFIRGISSCSHSTDISTSRN